MAAKFEIQSSQTGQYRWVLVSQGRTLAIGPTYARRAMVEKSIDSFRTAAIAAPVDDQAPTRGKTVAATTGRVAGRAVGEALATGSPQEQIEQGLAKLDATVAEIKEVTARTAKRAAKRAATVMAAAPAPKKTGGRKRTAKA